MIGELNRNLSGTLKSFVADCKNLFASHFDRINELMKAVVDLDTQLAEQETFSAEVQQRVDMLDGLVTENIRVLTDRINVADSWPAVVNTRLMNAEKALEVVVQKLMRINNRCSRM